MNILVLGIGQRLRGDDASGLEAVKLWRQDNPQTASRVRIEENEFPGLDLLNLMDGVDAAVIVDAVNSKVPIGTLIRIGMDELASFKPEEGSTHGWGVAETLLLGISINHGLAKCKITLIGIVGENFKIGTRLSPEVRAALPKASQMIERIISELMDCGNPEPVKH